MESNKADVLLAADQRKAWERYLRETRDATSNYDEVEPWAWSRLNSELGSALALYRKRTEGVNR